MNKIDFILLFDALDANPNGDPDAGNMPRMDSETGHGLVTDVCLKRKIRNFVTLTKGDAEGYDIYVKEKAILTNQQVRAYKAIGSDPKKSDIENAKMWMCGNFFDIRTFGAVMSLKEANCGQVRGPVQLSFARSIDPVMPNEYAITRCAVATEKESIKQDGDNRTMGRKYTIPYALYCAKGCINPFLAAQTGFSDEDLSVLISALQNMFTFDASAARPAGAMNMRKIILFKHDSQLGDAPAHKLYEMLKISKKAGVEAPRSIDDYDVCLDVNAAPAGVSIEVIE
ncbi:MAG: type I-C CRISPR-associated protein Cas7/Csd2 [Akkermansia sp.]